MEAFTRWHKTFEDMEAAVSEVLDHLEDYRGELTTLMTERCVNVTPTRGLWQDSR